MCRLRAYFSAIHYLALVCNESLIERRLRARSVSNTPLALDLERYIDTQRWVNRLYRDEANGDPSITLLDASTATPDALAHEIASWVRHHLHTGSPSSSPANVSM